jgi:hypothetical protein
MTLPTKIKPSTPAFSAIWGIGYCSAWRTMLMLASRSSLSPLTVIALAAISSMTPPAGTTFLGRPPGWQHLDVAGNLLGSASGFAALLGSVVGELFDVLGDVSRLIGRPVSQPAKLVGILVDVRGNDRHLIEGLGYGLCSWG